MIVYPTIGLTTFTLTLLLTRNVLLAYLVAQIAIAALVIHLGRLRHA